MFQICLTTIFIHNSYIVFTQIFLVIIKCDIISEIIWQKSCECIEEYGYGKIPLYLHILFCYEELYAWIISNLFSPN